jgi:hypothetical protein
MPPITFCVSELHLKLCYWCYRNSIKIFKIQNKIIRIITNLRNRVSCREMFKTMKILPCYSQYILSSLIYIANNRHLFIINQEIHSINTRPTLNFHIPNSNLSKFQKGVYCLGTKLFNHLPSHIEGLSGDIKLFITTLKRFLYSNSFYSIGEYFNFQGN